jgi:hypothetical protein
MNQDFYKWVVVWLGLVVVACGAKPQDFAEANRLFKAGDFVEAAQIYQNLIDENGPSSALFCNLGNSHQRNGDHGLAILAYERGKLLAPRDPDLRANLILARKAVGVSNHSEFNPAIEAVLTHLSRNEWSWLVVASALWIGVVAVTFGAARVIPSPLRRCAVGSLIFAGLMGAFGATALVLRSDEDRRGVVLSKDAGVLLSPFETADSKGTVGVGRIVMIGKKSGDFFYIGVPGTDLEGWVREKDVAWIGRGG